MTELPPPLPNEHREASAFAQLVQRRRAAAGPPGIKRWIRSKRPKWTLR
jgi:hypothetical protein